MNCQLVSWAERTRRVPLGLQPESDLRLFLEGTGFRVELADWSGREIEAGADGLPVLAHVDSEPLTVDEVRSIRNEFQR